MLKLNAIKLLDEKGISKYKLLITVKIIVC